MHILTWCKNSIRAHPYGHTHQYISDKIFPLLLGKPCKKNNRKRFYCKCYKLDGNMHKVLANNTTLNIILKRVIRYIIYDSCAMIIILTQIPYYISVNEVKTVREHIKWKFFGTQFKTWVRRRK